MFIFGKQMPLYLPGCPPEAARGAILNGINKVFHVTWPMYAKRDIY